MALKVEKMDVWQAQMEDHPGALAGKLSALEQAGADLKFVLARRVDGQPGVGIVFVAPLRGAKQTRAGEQAGFTRCADLTGLAVSGTDRPGLGAKIANALAEAGVNLRGLSAGVVGRQFVLHLALDTAADAAAAARVLRRA